MEVPLSRRLFGLGFIGLVVVRQSRCGFWDMLPFWDDKGCEG